MQRVAIVCGAGIVSGKEIVALELAEGLRSTGYHVDVATSRWGNGDFARRLKTSGFPVHLFWLGFISATFDFRCLYMTAAQLARWPGLLRDFQKLLRKVEPEKIVHTNWHHLLLLWPLLRAQRDLFWLHEVVPNKRQYRFVFQLLGRRLHCFVAVSHAVARSLREIGITPEKIRVIHNGLKDPAPADLTGPVKNGRLRVGVIGQIGAWKGHGDLLEAFAKVLELHPATELHVFGRGSEDYEAQLKSRAMTLGIAGNIVWRGYVADRAEIYRGLSVCVIPSRSQDPLPTVAIEAAFFAIPVVATRRGGLPEIVEDGASGFLVEPGQPASLASSLGILVGNDTLRAQMGRQARNLAVKNFNRERFVKDFADLLDAGKCDLHP